MPWARVPCRLPYRAGELENTLDAALRDSGIELPEGSLFVSAHMSDTLELHRTVRGREDAEVDYCRELRWSCTDPASCDDKGDALGMPAVLAFLTGQAPVVNETASFRKASKEVYVSLDPPDPEFLVSGDKSYLAAALAEYVGEEIALDAIEGDESGYDLSSLPLTRQSADSVGSVLQLDDVLKALVVYTFQGRGSVKTSR